MRGDGAVANASIHEDERMEWLVEIEVIGGAR